MARSETYSRFTVAQRLEHWIMALSFTMLTITGLPQRYALSDWAEWMISTMGGIETVRIIHRIAAVVFMAVLLYHFIVVVYKIYVLRIRLSMLPTFKDVTDLLDSVHYQLGITQLHPKFPRYNFAEKMEYWAVIWGAIIMAATGFMLWNPIATTRFLPGEFVPAAKAAHSAEALLAFLAIIIWHVYWVHFKTFNRAMFTGKLTRQQMLAEHAVELTEIEAGPIPASPAAEIQHQRERIFLPVASVISVVGIFGLYGFVTLEQTAITTVPPAFTAEAFVPATPTVTPTPLPTPTATPTPLGGIAVALNASLITHPLGGREECLECHAADGPLPYPENHQDFSVPTCTICHSTEQENPPPLLMEHKLRSNCLRCHEVDTIPESHAVANFTNEDCALCHPPSKKETAKKEPTATPQAIATPTPEE